MVLYEDFFVCCGWEEVEGFFAGGDLCMCMVLCTVVCIF